MYLLLGVFIPFRFNVIHFISSYIINHKIPYGTFYFKPSGGFFGKFKKYAYLPTYLPLSVLFIFCVDLQFNWVLFLWRTSFTISYRAGLLVILLSDFVCFKSVYFTFISKTFLLGMKFQINGTLFQYFKGVAPFSSELPCFQQEGCVHSYLCSHVGTVVLSLWFLYNLSSITSLSTFTIMCVDVL